ncbi:MAG: hypothetical protein ACOC0O_07830 [Spirochaetota bacterium]
MLIGTVLIALVFAVVLAALFGALFGGRSGVPGFVLVFVLLFLFAWAAAVWIGPIGPMVLGVYWLPGLVVTLLIFLLLAAFAERRPPRSTREARMEIEARNEIESVFGVLIWVVIGGLVVAILLAYLV